MLPNGTKPTQTEAGRAGEALALQEYKKRGCALLAKNYRFGHYEIDLILRERKTGTVIFCEVKARSDGTRIFPRTAVGDRKRTFLHRAAQAYCVQNGLADAPCRFDVAEVWLATGRVERIENAF